MSETKTMTESIAKPSPRFVRVPDGTKGLEHDDRTAWWFDQWRPLAVEDDQPFIAVQVYADKDPNSYVPIDGLSLLFTDQAEYYAVCGGCRFACSGMQWSGSTRSPNWRQRSQEFLEKHQREKGWCEFCDPVFGNGGWSR